MTKLTLKDVWNRDNEINGIKVCGVIWKNYPYMVLENHQTFDDAKSADFIAVESFKTLTELNKKLKELTSK